jgi:sarcosine oxidase
VARPRLVTAARPIPRRSGQPAARAERSERSEFVVVGGGITGLSAAWALARQGREVVLLDQAEIGHRGAGSHGSCRIFRLGYDDPAYVSLAGQARELWAELEDACGERLLLPTPQLTFGPQMALVQAAIRQAGAACELLPAQEAAARFPGVAVYGDVLFEPESAVIAADRSLATLAGLVEQAGPASGIRTGARVTALADDGRGVRVSTTAGDIKAATAIICAGPWTAGLLATAGITVPASATLEQVAYVVPVSGAATAPAMPIFVHYGGEFAYGLPVPGSERYKIGIHHGGPAVDPNHQDYAEDHGLTRRIVQAARTFLPGFDPRPVAVERCVYDNSPDTDFIVDRIGNVVVGSGTSGHGFKFGPLLGQWLAWLATSGTADLGHAGEASGLPARFAVSRF